MDTRISCPLHLKQSEGVGGYGWGEVGLCQWVRLKNVDADPPENIVVIIK